jgi:hypothetical protein
MPLQATSGAASYDAFGGGVAAVPKYIEECFASHLYTGTSSTQTINNGIDLAGKGGLVWFKNRGATINHAWFDTTRGTTVGLGSNLSSGNITTWSDSFTSFNSNGFTVGVDTAAVTNASANTYVSWTFREQPKFFDMVTYSGNGANRTIAHSLGSVPGLILVKRINGTGNWAVYHRSTGSTHFLSLNAQSQANPSSAYWNNTDPTSSVFTVGTDSNVNTLGADYIAYIFAHNAGGFGLSGNDNVISCGSFTTNSSSQATVDLGYEPQWVLIKCTDNSDSWFILDNMRGWVTGGNDARLLPNSSVAEQTGSNYGNITATGFVADGSYYANSNHIYIAIRRGPMKVPTTGTSVFAPVAYTGNGGTQIATTGFPVDAMIEFERTNSSGVPAAGGKYMTDRLRGSSAYLETSSTSAESTGFVFGLANNTGVALSTSFNSSSRTYIIEAFRRAPGFFDEVCYTGSSTAGRQVTHNLGAVPELMIVKARTDARDWMVYCSGLTANNFIKLNLSNAQSSSNYAFIFGNDTVGIPPTSSVFTVGTGTDVNNSSNTYVAYLFATCPGVSKVFNFTGNGSSQTINCGFTGGARFVMIKRTDSTGDWYVWDTARGIVANNDPHLSLNTTAAEVTSNDTIDTDSTGFVVNQVSATNVNVNGATYIGLAIA